MSLMIHRRKPEALILGGGPASLACALELGKNEISTVIYERESSVGGLCRTLKYNGNYFDIGGHRFFTKNAEIRQLWKDILGDDILYVKRKSRIYYRGKYYAYPLKLFNVISNLGWISSLRCVLSYLLSLVFRPGNESTFDGWVINRFGRRLYRIFFKTYTEKVWNIPCHRLSSDWAIQRIQGMSMKRAIVDAIWGDRAQRTKSFVKEFIYPTYGPGLFCNKLHDVTVQIGCTYYLESTVISVRHTSDRISEILYRDKNGKISSQEASMFFSSIPITSFVSRLDPKPPLQILKACQNLKYRSFCVVNLFIDAPSIFDDNWIYIHDPDVHVARIQNYKNWSHFMVKDSSVTTLGCEYFVDEDDALWRRTNEALIALATEEVVRLGLIKSEKVLSGFVVRVPKVYPIYDETYKGNLDIIKEYLARFSNLSVMGRCGMFRYDNSDHALMTGLCAARNYLGASYNLWDINTEQEYHEELGPYNRDLG